MLIAEEGEQICGFLFSDPTKYKGEQLTAFAEGAEEPYMIKRMVSGSKKTLQMSCVKVAGETKRSF